MSTTVNQTPVSVNSTIPALNQIQNVPTITNTNINSSLTSATSISYMDELVKEYLIFRGCTTAYKAFDHELKQDKDRLFKPDKIVDQIFSYIHTYDLTALLEFWSYLDQKYFSQIIIKASNGTILSRKYELSILRYYLIYSIQNNRTDKAVEFFEKLASTLQLQPEWKEWFCLPYVKNPEDNSQFSVYFSKIWLDTFSVSLQNFFSIVFQSVQFPRLLLYDEDAYWNNQSNNKTSQSVISSEYDLYNQEITDEFQIQQPELTQPSGSTFISMLKSLGSTNFNKKPLNKTQSAANMATHSSISSTLVSAAQQNMNAKVQSTKSPIEAFIEASKPTSSSAARAQSSDKSQRIKTFRESLGSANSTVLENDERDSELSRLNKKQSEPYTIIKIEKYLEHKSPIVNCKHSNDGHRVVSVDIDGLMKVWSRDDGKLNSQSTYTQQSAILSIEWDCKQSNILYIGSNSGVLKSYDINESKTIQEIIINTEYPRVAQIKHFPNQDKILAVISTQLIKSKNEVTRNSQLVVLTVNSKINYVTVEKTIDLDGCFSQCIMPYGTNYAFIGIFDRETVLTRLNRTPKRTKYQASIRLDKKLNWIHLLLKGCSDGFIRIFDLNKMEITNLKKCHTNNILNVSTNKSQTKLYTIDDENQLKVWFINSIFLQLSTPSNPINFYKLPDIHNNTPFGTYEPDSAMCLSVDGTPTRNRSFSFGTSRPFTCLGTLMVLDVNENLIFLINKNGVILYRPFSNLTRLGENQSESNIKNSNELETMQLFPCDHPTSIDLRTEFQTTYLVVGCLDGTIHLFKLQCNNT